METLGKRIQRLRKARGLTIVALARAAGVSASTLRDWEYGRSIKGEPYLKLAEALDVSVYQLLSGHAPQISELKKAMELLWRAEEIIQNYERSLK